MTNYSDDDEIENHTKNTDPLGDRKRAPQDNNAAEESGDLNNDALQELRQNLFSEEQPQDPNKNDIFKRMTESLSNRKVPQPPKENNRSDRGFGVRTAGGGVPYESTERPEADTDSTRNTVILQGGPKAEPFVQGWPKTRQPDPNEDQDEYSNAEGHEEPSTQKVSKVRAVDSDDQEAVWKNYSGEGSTEQKLPVSILDEKVAQTQGEKKRLPSGFDRQQQVSRYISYNPKRSLREQYNELSKIEKTLLITLVVAVVGLLSLIAYLFIESRQPGFGSNNYLATEFTPSPVVSPPVPIGIVLTGGWSFDLGSGIMVDGVWNPTKSEWLVGTEVRRDIAIPWNVQIQAVVQTFQPGDLIELKMSNGDSYPYKVLTVSEVPVSDTSILYDVRPTMAIILIKPDAEKRWVVIAEPQ